MDTLKLTEDITLSSIPIPSTFIIQHMPKAHPLYNMVYLYGYSLYFLKKASSNQSIAQTLGMLESDVIKAWEYWNEKGLVRIIDRKSFSEFNIQFLITGTHSTQATESTPSDKLPVSTSEDVQTYLEGLVETYEPVEANKFNDLLTQDQSDVTVKKLIKMAEKELGTPMNQYKANIILGFHYDYGLPLEVIQELFKYCKARRKTSISYIEKIAISWAKLKINSKEQVALYNKEFGDKANQIFKIQTLIGIPRDGTYTPEEDEMYQRWCTTYGYTLEIIQAAASRAVQNGNKGNLPYIDGILKNWYNNGVRIPADIEKVEATISDSYKKQKESTSKQVTKAPKPTSLNNFEGTPINYDEIMKKHKNRTAKDLFQ